MNFVFNWKVKLFFLMNNLFELVLVMCFKVIRMLFGGGEVNIVLVIVIESMFGFI